MKNKERIIYGLLITLMIFVTAKIISSKVPLNSDLIPDSFISLTVMLLLSIIAINVMRKYLTYKFSLPKLRNIFKPISLAILVTIGINLFMSIVSKIIVGTIDVHPALMTLKPLQLLIFVFFYASIVEEVLFRGFLLNLLKPIKSRGIKIFNRKISLPVIISGLAFGFAHLALITTGVDAIFLVRVVLFASSLGIIAGYYQEKYDNNSYAIVVHMAGNSLAVLAAFITVMNG